jgi:rifampin ADP-ribosylating transferase
METPGRTGETTHIPVTLDSYDHVEGPFYHGTKAPLQPGDLLFAGRDSNFEDGRVSNNIYFSASLDAATWAAELARGDGPGRIYIVEPTGPFEDDPNLTNKRFPGNPTRSYRSRHPLRILGELENWEPHPPEVLQGMLDSLADLRRQGLATIED